MQDRPYANDTWCVNSVEFGAGVTTESGSSEGAALNHLQVRTGANASLNSLSRSGVRVEYVGLPLALYLLIYPEGTVGVPVSN